VFISLSSSFWFAQDIVLSHVTISFDATTRMPMNSHKQMHRAVLCSCGARLESNDALIDHHDWCLGSGRANARLFERYGGAVKTSRMNLLWALRAGGIRFLEPRGLRAKDPCAGSARAAGGDR
jgi:hypothetical protein